MHNTQQNITAGFLIIGNEILSGRTQDKNLNYLAKILNSLGILLQEVRIVSDIEINIVNAVNELKKNYTYVFTSGGIGPTHDDITSQSIAIACNDDLILNQQAAEILYKFYGKDNVNEARLKMAKVPSRAKLLNNPVSSAPGFNIDNIFVMAGIPKIFQAMLDCIVPTLKTGNKIYNQELTIALTESVIAKDLTELQKQFPQVCMGSYPFSGGTSLVFRGINENEVKESCNLMQQIVLNINKEAIIKLDAQ